MAIWNFFSGLMDKGLANVSASVVVTIGVYVVAIMFIGWWSSRRIHNMDDFLVAGRKLPFWMAAATILATWFGAGSSMGVAGAVYDSGISSVVADPFGAAFSLIIAGFFYVAVLRRMRLLTVTDIVERAYGRNAGIYAALWMVPVYIGWLGVQIMGIGKILHLLFGINELAGSFVGAALILIYTYAGGMWAVTLTDIVQVVLIIFGLSLIMPGAIGSVGGLGALIDKIPAHDLSLLPNITTDGTENLSIFNPESPFGQWVSYCGQWLTMGLGCIVGQDLIQRSLASRTPNVAKSSAITAGIGYLLIGVIPITIGFCARYIVWDTGMAPELFNPDGSLVDPESLIPLMAVQILPTALLALFLSALVSAIMSSADSSLLAASSLITNNVVRPCCTRISDHNLLITTRVFTVLVLVVSLTLALTVEKMFSLLVCSWSSQLLVIFIPVTTALYFPKVGRHAVWWSMIAGPLVWICYTFGCAGMSFTECPPNGLFMSVAYGFMAAVLVGGALVCFHPERSRTAVVTALVGGLLVFTVAFAYACPNFAVANISDNMLYCGSTYGFLAAIAALIAGAVISPRKPGEPVLWVPRRDEDVPPELEKAAKDDDIQLPPILS